MNHMGTPNEWTRAQALMQAFAKLFTSLMPPVRADGWDSARLLMREEPALLACPFYNPFRLLKEQGSSGA